MIIKYVKFVISFSKNSEINEDIYFTYFFDLLLLR